MTERKVSLSRPVLREAPAQRAAWPGSVAVLGRDAAAFAERLRDQLLGRGTPARVLRVELRHASGFDRHHGPLDTRIDTHPEALADAVADARAASSGVTIGVGTPFAAAVRAELVIFLRAGESLLTLPPLERMLAREAHLVLDEPRLETADALAARLHRWRAA
jgi:hypothetical protein